MADCPKILLIILAILLPPLAVFLTDEECGAHLLINVILTFLFYIPGIIHAIWYVITKG